MLAPNLSAWPPAIFVSVGVTAYDLLSAYSRPVLMKLFDPAAIVGWFPFREFRFALKSRVRRFRQTECLREVDAEITRMRS